MFLVGFEIAPTGLVEVHARRVVVDVSSPDVSTHVPPASEQERPRGPGGEIGERLTECGRRPAQVIVRNAGKDVMHLAEGDVQGDVVEESAEAVVDGPGLADHVGAPDLSHTSTMSIGIRGKKSSR